MKLSDLEPGKCVLLCDVGDMVDVDRLGAMGIRPGATLEVLMHVSFGGILIKIDDTRVVLSFELAQKITCAYI